MKILIKILGDGWRNAVYHKLQAGSPCINTSMIIPNNGSKDLWGNALYNGLPDIGAMEF